ncbi:hypothetical protein CK934_27970 [Chitinophaga sp. MD30]|nr:hypothetical protein CK934_27970 [Chitinophaga sp. MD30]
MNQMSKKVLIDKIKALFSSIEQAGELQTAMLQNGTVIQYSVLEAGGTISTIAADGVAIPAEPGQYTLEDGRIIVVAESGRIDEVKPAANEDEKTEMSEPAPAVVDWAPVIDGLKGQLEQYAKRVSALEGANAKFSAAFRETLGIVETMANEPDGKPIHTPRQSVFSETKKIEKAHRFDRLKQALK